MSPEPSAAARWMRCVSPPERVRRLAVEGQVVEPHPVEDLDPLGQLLEQVPGDLALAGVHRRSREPGPELLHAQRRSAPGAVGPTRRTARASGWSRVPPQSGQGV